MRTKLVLLAVLVAASCTRRPHTRSDFGVPNHTFFDRQAAAAGKGSAQGLDSEEAAATQQHYRETLGTKGGSTAPRNDPRSSVLILGEDRNDATKGK